MQATEWWSTDTNPKLYATLGSIPVWGSSPLRNLSILHPGRCVAYACSPSTQKGERERQVDTQLKVKTTAKGSPFCCSLLAPANSVLKFLDWWLIGWGLRLPQVGATGCIATAGSLRAATNAIASPTVPRPYLTGRVTFWLKKLRKKLA